MNPGLFRAASLRTPACGFHRAGLSLPGGSWLSVANGTRQAPLRNMRTGGRVLRSRTPGLARQETWALLIACQAVRALICHAAAGMGADPGRLSFTTALHAARRTLGRGPAAIQAAGDEILASPLPGRPPRTCARALAEPQRGYPSRKGKPQPLPQRIHCTITVTTPDTTTRQPRHQHKHATDQAAASP